VTDPDLNRIRRALPDLDSDASPEDYAALDRLAARLEAAEVRAERLWKALTEIASLPDQTESYSPADTCVTIASAALGASDTRRA
jgi:hypothetical protein